MVCRSKNGALAKGDDDRDQPEITLQLDGQVDSDRPFIHDGQLTLFDLPSESG